MTAVPILHWSKSLTEPPRPIPVAGIELRTICLPQDIPAWLRLRERAFEGETPPVGPWTEHDFSREFLSQPWFRPARLWIALVEGRSDELVGAVAMSRVRRSEQEFPAIHWLLVDPSYRRRGIGRLLIATLEQAAWDDGDRQVRLETHAGWRSAAELYRALGYGPTNRESAETQGV